MNPLLTALRTAHAALDDAVVRDDAGGIAGWKSVSDLSPTELAEAVSLQAGLESRMAGLRLHVVAAAEACDAAAVNASTDVDAWASRAAGRNRPRTWGSLGLAQNLEGKYAHVRAALTQGAITEDHARIIVRACEKVSDTLDRLRMDARVRGLSEEQVDAAVPTVTHEELAECEALLVAKALMMPPKRLTVAARRVLTPLRKRLEVRLPDVDPDLDPETGELTEVDLADVVADDQVRDAERAAMAEAYLFMDEDADGCWTGRFKLPPLAGQALRLQLEHRTSPRRAHLRQAQPEAAHPTGVQVDPTNDDTTSLPTSYGTRLGWAFCELLEHLPTDAQGRFGTNDVTVVVHVEEQTMRTGIGTAVLDTGAEISASEARRLACNAGILPMVLSGATVPTDLGREQRLFSRYQALALSAYHDTCAAQGCERPFAWCELHHLCPWSHHGPTDLDNAVPLCGHHHRRIHDPMYHHHVHPDGSITFEHRWPSRNSTTRQRRALRAVRVAAPWLGGPHVGPTARVTRLGQVSLEPRTSGIGA